MIKLLKKRLVFLVMVLLFLVGIPNNVKAASYPTVFFFGDENFENLVLMDEVLQGEKYNIRMEWHVVYENEGYDMVITDSSGETVAETSYQFTNLSNKRWFVTSWDTKDIPSGRYTVTVTKKFYSLFRWNEAPTKDYLILNVVSVCDKNGHTIVKDARKEATCGKSGLSEGSHCSVCNKVIVEQNIIPATGRHTYDGWKTTRKATVSTSGRKQHKCTVCGKTETNTIPRLKPTLKLSKTKATIRKGRSLKIKVLNLAYGDKVVSWKTSNKKIATVKNGKIKAIKKGKAVITVRLKSGKKATVKITVK